MKIHFLGMGKMGLPMAGHLARAGHVVTVGDASPQRLVLAREAGLTVDDDAVRALAQAQVVFSSLPHDAALRSVAREVAMHACAGVIHVDTSTVSPQVSAEVAGLLAERGMTSVRVTVSGNNKMAEAAQLTVMASGPRAAYDAVEPLLAVFGPHRFYLGEQEQARLMKLVVNLMIAQTSAMLAEALILGRQGGLDWQAMWQVLTASAVASPILKAKSMQLAVRDFTPTFTVEQMIKDLDLILDAGVTVGAPLAQTAMTQRLMREAVTLGLAGEDYAAIVKVIERHAGISDAP